MRISVNRSKIKGRVSAPASKSYTIRGLVCAALARGESEIIDPLVSDDTAAAREVLGGIGVDIHTAGNSWQVSGGNLRAPTEDLHCRESAATLRFMSAVCSLIPGKCRLSASQSLARRPIEPLLKALRQLGVSCRRLEPEAVVEINGGQIKSDITELPGNISSQFVSSLLFISPRAENGMKIRLTTPPESRPYIQMTLDCLKEFGIEVKTSADMRQFEVKKQEYQPTRYRVEGDWSSASSLLALGALAGEITVDNLNQASPQADRAMLGFLRDMAAAVTVNGNSVSVKKAGLKPLQADLSDCIDLLPVVAVLASAAEGTSRLTGIERGRLKESNRVAAVREGLEKMGIEVSEEKNKLTITGSPPQGAVIDSHKDHRIAMAFSLPGIISGETVINGAECVDKTYPAFWDTIKSIGGEVETDGK